MFRWVSRLVIGKLFLNVSLTNKRVVIYDISYRLYPQKENNYNVRSRAVTFTAYLCHYSYRTYTELS